MYYQVHKLRNYTSCSDYIYRIEDPVQYVKNEKKFVKW